MPCLFNPTTRLLPGNRNLLWTATQFTRRVNSWQGESGWNAN